MENLFEAARQRALRCIGVSSVVFLAACGHGPSGPGTGTAKVSFELIPTDVACIVIDVVGSDGGTTADGGSTFTKPFQVSPQANSVFSLTGLPLGNDTFSAEAYTASEGCPPMTGAPAAYTSNSVVALVTSNPPVNVTLYMGGTSGEGVVTVDFPVPIGTITEFPIPTASSQAGGITTGPDGSLWFTEVTNKIGRITVDGGFTEFSVPTTNSYPYGIAAGPDGDLWFTEDTSASKIGRITTTGSFAEFSLPAFSLPDGITAGPDGNMWCANGSASGSGIGRITLDGTVTVFSGIAASSEATDIAAGSDGNLWFTESSGNNIGRITTDGGITEFPVPTQGSLPHGIAAGADGNLWFTEYLGNKIGRIATDGGLTEFLVPTASSDPAFIAAGPDGNLWFTEYLGNNIGRITTSGVITEFAVPTAASQPWAISAGPDGNVWFTEMGGNNIGRITTL